MGMTPSPRRTIPDATAVSTDAFTIKQTAAFGLNHSTVFIDRQIMFKNTIHQITPRWKE
jgi:hypothetical protein